MKAVLAISILAATATAQVTHLGVSTRDHVVLEMVAGVREGCGAGKVEFMRTMADGTAGETAFRVPEGRVLIVTEVDWFYYQYPRGWNEARVRAVLDYYESQSDAAAAAEIEAGVVRADRRKPLPARRAPGAMPAAKNSNRSRRRSG